MNQSPTGRAQFIGRRRFFTQLLGAGAAAAYGLSTGRVHAQEPAGDELRITYFTDIHARTEWDTPQAMMRAARMIREQSSDLVLCGGDLITDGFQSAMGGVQERWDVAGEMIRAIEQPVAFALGNHDLEAAIPKDGSPASPDPRKAFLSFTNQTRTYRSFNVKGHHCIILDPFRITQDKQKYIGIIEADQMEWLKQDLLQVDPGTPIVLVCHMPLLTAFYQMTRDATAPGPANRVLTNNTDVLRLFKNHNLRLVLQGHLHVQEVLKWQGITFITGGAVCGKWWRGNWHGTSEGFGTLRLHPEGIDWEYIRIPWDVMRPKNA